jgi:hypothetical protein
MVAVIKYWGGKVVFDTSRICGVFSDHSNDQK